MDKKSLIRNFSRYAYLYDRYADMQKESARELLAAIKGNSFAKILEIGCGTGNYTALLRRKFKEAKIKALDISPKMIEVAKDKLRGENIGFLIADAERLNSKEAVDLITSNACFQWFTDLGKALARYKKILRRGGIISFSTFGPLTLRELNAALNCAFKGVSIEAASFMPRKALKALLKKNFKTVKIKEMRYRESFINLARLLKKIKYSGIRGNGLTGKAYFSRGFLKRVEEAYRNKFKKIQATYQVFFCQCRK